MKVSAQYAEAHLPDLLEAAFNGDEVEIAMPDKPTVKLVVVYPPAAPKQTGRRILGAGVGLVKVPTEDEWYAMKKQLEHDMLGTPVFPPEQP
jgi:antitoxin (DNA-binding transcriptional repressor) of toxin-antitoxin stability system